MRCNVSVDDALRIILSSVRSLPQESVPLLAALGRICSVTVKATTANPPHDNSAMDGYGVRAGDTANAPVTLPIAGTIFAGGPFRGRMQAGRAVKIMTGAKIPPGVDAIVPFEEAREKEGRVLIARPAVRGTHIRRKGEDFRKGEVLIPKGRLIRPAEAAILSALGTTRIRVFRRPRVAVLATGDELVPADRPLGRGRIRDSNSPALAASVLQCGADPVLLGIGRDSVKHLKRKMAQGVKADALIMAGGVSAGEADYGRDALLSLGGRLLFFKVRQRPGHPLAFGRLRGRPVFILPGNPVSAMLTFQIYVRPALMAMRGASPAAGTPIQVELGEDVSGKAGRTEFLRVRLRERNGRRRAFLTGPQGSGILTSMARADGYIVVPEDSDRLRKGSVLPVYPL